MKCDLQTTPYFERRSRRFLRRHPDLVPTVDKVLAQLAEDPDAPSLRLHHLSGKLAGHQAVSVTYDYRIVLVLRRDVGVITLIDIGSHDEDYRG